MIEKGIESLKASVMKDCQNGENCFSENGCTKIRYASLPEENPELINMGFTTKCVAQTKCTHDYCGKYKWVLERAQHYAEKIGKTNIHSRNIAWFQEQIFIFEEEIDNMC